MATLNKQEVEKNISHLLDIVALGDEIIITKKGEVFAKIIPSQKIPPKPHLPRVAGMDARKIWISKDFDAPLPEYILRDFGC
jgi:antitoxin (DNA-binding transcriptional repressor) of toxin-antitoxin stability system